VNSEQALSLVIDCLKESFDDEESQERQKMINEVNSDTRLFGGDGLLDSMGVVILLTDLEDKLDEDFGITISLADDSAMSKTRSPFRTVKSLSKYILETVSA
tara:strand:- start:124 stop:429 length:306 start_codon:yes stop_codon:yes gene_type:complete